MSTYRHQLRTLLTITSMSIQKEYWRRKLSHWSRSSHKRSTTTMTLSSVLQAASMVLWPNLGLKIDDENFFKAYDQMMRMNVDSTLLSNTIWSGSFLATQLLKNQGTLILTGAEGVFKTPAPDMLSYTLAKNMVHSIAHNLSKGSVFNQDKRLITILP